MTKRAQAVVVGYRPTAARYQEARKQRLRL